MSRRNRERYRRAALALLGSMCVGVPTACGGSAATPQAALATYLAAWSHGDWGAMRRIVADPPADFATVNAAALAGLHARRTTFTTRTFAHHGSDATATVAESFVLPRVGTWHTTTLVRLSQRNGRWLVHWSSATINPALRAGDRLAAARAWPERAPILGAGGVSLTASRPRITVGIVGRRIHDVQAVAGDLLAAGASSPEIRQALLLAKAHPDDFEPVYAVSRPRFDILKRAPGPDNVYRVPGTAFLASSSRSAITEQLGAHVVGRVAPITADQLTALGSPYDASSQVGQTGLEQAYERRLAGTPTIKVQAVSAAGAPLQTLARFPGRAPAPVRTSLDPSVQRAAESALAGVPVNAAMVALRASTGQLLAVVSDPPGESFDQALAGAYPPGSTFKVLTSAALIASAGLTPASPATCTPTISVDGEPFHNAEGDQPVQTLDQGFTESCNTTFIRLALTDLRPSDFADAAHLFGLDRTPALGLPAFGARVPVPSSRTELAATAIGQASVAFSPLGMASVAASVDSGRVFPPRLVVGADDRGASRPLPADVLAGLRSMMAHVVQGGTAAGTGLPADTHAKTGTAQYGRAGQLKLDGWLMGYRGDIAFAVVAQDTGGVDGGPFDGPLMAKFLAALAR